VSGGRIALIVTGVIVALIGLAIIVGGAILLWAHQALRDDDGFFTSDTERFATPLRAIVSEDLDITDVPGGSDRWADLRVRAERPDGRPVFVGVGPRDDVERYLAGVPHAVLTDVDLDPFRATYQPQPGGRAPGPPADEGFWAAEQQGPGEQTLEWDVDDGDWQIVAMNADGSPGVVLDASVGMKISYVLGFAIGALVVGVLLLGGGIAMAVLGGRRRRAPPPGPAPAGSAEGSTGSQL
jgi:hypothetical protein